MLNLELVSINLNTARIATDLEEKEKEFTKVKTEHDKIKSDATAEVAKLKKKEETLSKLKSELKEETEKLEETNKQNIKITEEIIAIYKQSMLFKEALGDEQVKQKILKDKLAIEKGEKKDEQIEKTPQK